MLNVQYKIIKNIYTPSPDPFCFLDNDVRIYVFSLPSETNDDIAKPSIYSLYVYD